MHDQALAPISHEPFADSVAVATGIETDELLQAFLSGKSPKTIDAYKRDWEDFRQFIEARDMDHVARIFLSCGLHKANHLALKLKTYLVEGENCSPQQ